MLTNLQDQQVQLSIVLIYIYIQFIFAWEGFIAKDQQKAENNITLETLTLTHYYI